MPKLVRQRVAGYVRTSTDEQERLATHEAQVSWLEQQAKASGWDMTLFVEAGVSGETIEARPRFRELLAAVEAGRFDLVAVRRVDRLSRSKDWDDWAKIARVFKYSGTPVYADGVELDLRKPQQQFMMGVQSQFSSLEKAVIVERTTAGAKRALSEGRKPRGYDPIGLHYDRPKRTWSIDEDEAERVRQLYDWAGRGLTTREIERRARAEGLLSRAGKHLNHSQVCRILRSRVYVGEWVFTIDGLTGTVPVPAIVDRLVWQRVQAKLGDPSQKTRPELHELAGFARCAACDLPVHSSNTTKGRISYLSCGSLHAHYRAKGRTPCHGSWRRDRVADAVWSTAVRLVSSPAFLARAKPKDTADEAGQLQRHLEAAEKRVRQLDAKLTELTTRWTHDLESGDGFRRAMAVVEREHALASERLTQARAGVDAARGAAHEAKDTATLLDRYRANLENADSRLRRMVLTRLFARRGTGVFLRGEAFVMRGLVPAAFVAGAPSSIGGPATVAFEVAVSLRKVG